MAEYSTEVENPRRKMQVALLRGVAGGDGELGCLCGKAGSSHLCDGSTHSSGCVVNGYGCLLSYYYPFLAALNKMRHRLCTHCNVA